MSRLKNRYFLTRFLALILITLVLWAGSTNLLYNYIARPLLLERRSKDLLPQATWIASHAGDYFLEGDALTENLVNVSYNFFSVWTMVFFSDNRSLETPLPAELPVAAREAIRLTSYNVHLQCMNGKYEKPFGAFQVKDYDANLLYVMAPIYSTFFSNFSDLPVGTVVMIQPMADYDLSIHSLNLALLISSLICGLLLLIPAFLGFRKIMQPIQQIREVAVAITQGDFSKKVDVDPKRQDEISDLANALSQMSTTIYQSMHELHMERKQLQEIMSGISEGIIAVDQSGHITHINEIVWSLFDVNPDYYTAEELMNMHNLYALFLSALRKERFVSEQLYLEDNNRIILASINPVFSHERTVSSAVGLFRDITKSEQLEQTRRDYVANVSHELRTPITAMRALIEPLRDGMVKNPEDRQRYYEIIYKETLRLSRLIDDMLELSRLQSGTGFIEQGPLDLASSFRDMSEHFSFLCEEKGVAFSTEQPSGDLPIIWGNEDRIEQILLTYLDNALKFTGEEGKIIFRVQLTDKECLLEIEDNGSGIKAEDIPFVFERFYKADKAHNEEGTGLGLSIAKALADQLSMSVSVRSTLGKGSTFALGIRYAHDVMKKEKHMKEVFDLSEEDK